MNAENVPELWMSAACFSRGTTHAFAALAPGRSVSTAFEYVELAHILYSEVQNIYLYSCRVQNVDMASSSDVVQLHCRRGLLASLRPLHDPMVKSWHRASFGH